MIKKATFVASYFAGRKQAMFNLQPSQHKEIIMHLAKLVNTIAVAMARASILWLIGEYSDRVPKIAPDVLRKMAKIFVDEVI